MKKNDKNREKFDSGDWLRLKAEEEKHMEQNSFSNSKTIQERNNEEYSESTTGPNEKIKLKDRLEYLFLKIQYFVLEYIYFNPIGFLIIGILCSVAVFVLQKKRRRNI